MANIEKPKFHILDVSGSNYLSWCLDIELHLQGHGLSNTIDENGDANDKDKANALIFIRRHLCDSLKVQYLAVRDPLTLWTRLRERYDHTKTVILPQARYDWQHLRLQDFKSVSEYNSMLFDIVSRLELCGVKLTEAELLEKTFSTFHASNIVLQQQYRERQFKTYSELISVLLTAEQNNELLLKNHELRPAGSKALPEVNAIENKTIDRSKGHNRRHGNFSQKGKGRRYNNTPKNSPKGKVPMKKHGNCHRCGMTGHWSRICRTTKHLVDLYQASQKRNKRVESHAMENDQNMANAEINATVVEKNPYAVKAKTFEVSDFLEDHDRNE